MPYLHVTLDTGARYYLEVAEEHKSIRIGPVTVDALVGTQVTAEGDRMDRTHLIEWQRIARARPVVMDTHYGRLTARPSAQHTRIQSERKESRR